MRKTVLLGLTLILGACVGDMGSPHQPWTDGGDDPDGGSGSDGGISGEPDGSPETDGDVTDQDEPPTRPVDPEDGDLPDDGGPPPDDGGDSDPVDEGIPPGGPCDCDSDCQATGGYAPLCIHGICGVRATDDRCPAGSSSPCPAGHRCWSGTGRGVCYPDYVPGQCAGRIDSDGSCVTDGTRDCYRVCGELCDLAGSPPDGGDPPEDPCGGLDYLGECDGDTARWCADGRIHEVDCRSRGLRCAYVDDRIGYFCTDSGGTAPPTPDPGMSCDDPVVVEQIRLTNEARRSAGLRELTCDEGLTRAAYLHSQDMCNLSYFSHRSRDGRSFMDRIDAQGVTYGTAGENIAWGQSTADEVHRSWMNSRGHRANILNGAFGRIGVGYEPCGGRPLWTQDFTD